MVSYCHIGQRATVIYFTAKMLGYDAKMYDGSWEDWSHRKDLPIVTGESPSKTIVHTVACGAGMTAAPALAGVAAFIFCVSIFEFRFSAFRVLILNNADCCVIPLLPSARV